VIALSPRIPTAMTPAEALALSELAAGRTVLEIGSLLGYSTIVMANVAKKVWAIDPHRGYPVADPQPTLNGFLQNLADYQMLDKVIPILGDAREVLPALRGHFDLIFIDITRHAGELIFLANNLDPRWIALHDYNHPTWTGATEAIDSFFLMRSYPMRIVDRLAILDIASARDAWHE